MLRDSIYPKWTVPPNMSQMVAFASGFSSPLYDPSGFTNEQDGTLKCAWYGGGVDCAHSFSGGPVNQISIPINLLLNQDTSRNEWESWPEPFHWF